MMTTTEEFRKFAIKCVKDRLGAAEDNLYRAERAFKGHTSTQLDSIYGQGCSTEREILDGYRESKKEAEATIAWLEGV